MKPLNIIVYAYSLVFCFTASAANAQSHRSPFRIIGYYCGPTSTVDSFETEKLTHLIFCFCNLKQNQLHINNATDTATLKKMVALKKQHPQLKVMLSLGGWGGCETCSDVFNTRQGREEFAASVKEITAYFHTDGIDLDWEYPAIKGFPGHRFRPADKKNFTLLLKELRKINGEAFEISFAAGGFSAYIFSAVEWSSILPYVNFINIMSYDLVHGFSTKSGHHTPLYSTKQQLESTDHAVQLLLDKNVPAEKLVIGAAFYGRLFQISAGHKTALYAPCKFSHAFSAKNFTDTISAKNGFTIYWDDEAKAPYAINEKRKLLATYDDERSVALKTKYAVNNNLGGVMFWQMIDDKFHDGLLDVIYKNKSLPVRIGN